MKSLKKKSVTNEIEKVLDETKRNILRIFFLRRNDELKNGIRMTDLEKRLKVSPRYLQSYLDDLVKSHLLFSRPYPPRRGEPKTYFLNIADDLTVRENYDTESILRAWKYAFQWPLVNDILNIRNIGKYSNKILIVETDDIGNKEISHLLMWSTFDINARPDCEDHHDPGPPLPVYVVYPIVKNESIRIGREAFKRKPEFDETNEFEDNIRNIKFSESFCPNNVGREHAEIYIHNEYYNDQIMLKDISSDRAAKTIVITKDKHGAEKEMEVGKGKEVVIEDGDKIRIENLTFEIASPARYNMKEFVKYEGSVKYEGRFKIVLVPAEKLYSIIN